MPELLAPSSPATAIEKRVALLEERLARIEARLSTDLPTGAVTAAEEPRLGPSGENVTSSAPIPTEDELERQVGQPGFALAGVIALTIGVSYMLSLPYPKLPAALPAVLGITLAMGLLVVAQFTRRRAGVLIAGIRGSAMVLLFFATLRLYFFSPQPALALDSFAGRSVLILAVMVNLAVAWERRSAWLVLLAFMMGCAAAIVVNATAFLLPTLLFLTAAAIAAERWRGWTALPLAGLPLVYLTYFAWSIGNPFMGGRFHYVTASTVAPATLLLIVALFAAGSLFRKQHDAEDGLTNTVALLNCVLGYACFLLHTAAAFPHSFVALHTAAFAILLGGAVLFWIRERSRVPTFLYALTGYAALSMAILKAAPSPEVFVWLSLQSVVVVATAIWFRSRLIVVANFLIYAAIVLGYMLVAERETGISIGFGLVALVSARILNWQRDRLELKTDLMRNAYLFSAFVVFPYALAHLVPGRDVALAWIGLAVGYYVLSLIGRNQKYRWMGHATLGLAALFLVLAGPDRLNPAYRVASFLALGTVLLVVSMTLGRGRHSRT